MRSWILWSTGRAATSSLYPSPSKRRMWDDSTARCRRGVASAAPRDAAGGAAAAGLEQALPGLLAWFDKCNDGLAVLEQQAVSQAEPLGSGAFVPFFVDGSAVGYMRTEFAWELAQFPEVFSCCGLGSSSGSGDDGSSSRSASARSSVALSPALSTSQQRTAAVAHVLDTLRQEGKVMGWRDELWPVAHSFHDEPLLLLERAAATSFGIKSYGVHVNGYVTLPDGSQEMWVGRRSSTKSSWAGKLDQIAAGGQPHGLSCAANMAKECEEEAGIPAQLAAKARPVGAIAYTALRPAGLKRDVLFVFDLELPLDFVPQPQDGEAEGFVRMPVPEVAWLAATTNQFKDNCNLVIADFLVRQGYLTPEMPGYCILLAALRAGDCS